MIFEFKHLYRQIIDKYGLTKAYENVNSKYNNTKSRLQLWYKNNTILDCYRYIFVHRPIERYMYLTMLRVLCIRKCVIIRWKHL